MMRIASSAFYQTAVNTIDNNQNTLAKLQTQMSSSLRMQTAADDPAAAGQVLGIDKSMSDVSQWQSNATALNNSLGLEDNALSAVTTALGQIQTLALQANNATLGASDRQAIAQQMQQQYNVLLQQANTQDSNGRYLFAGTNDGSAPFTQTASGVSYGGNSNLRTLSVGPTSEIAAGDPGDAVFMQMRSGDGSISVGAASGNTGTASLTAAQVTDPTRWDSAAYTLSFSSGQYQVTDSSNTVISSGAYTAGTAIQFRGASVTLSGTPADGDSFSVGGSSTQDLFSGVQNLINLVKSPQTTAAQRAQTQTAMYGALQSLSGAQAQILSVQSGVGAREQSVTATTTQLQARATQLKSVLSSVQDLDFAAATAEFSKTQLTLQAAEQSYVTIQGMSLFNYLK